jgi:hypothetical protein
MRSVDGTQDLLLDDGTYFVQLDPERRVDEEVAVAYLGRRGIGGDTQLVGSVEMQTDGRWRASVATDPAQDSQGYRRVTSDRENRFDAIVALWQNRSEAFVNLGSH